ncbi:hypothetical protein MUP38_04625, partial [Candidatus Bathyarchaeota archaeon]|nr:hypothetical protein [Candidatus Bathyarchaeota archaeon]
MADEKTRKEFLDLLSKSNPRTRKTTLRLIENKVSEDDTVFAQEELNFVEADATVRSVSIIATKTCDYGHLLDQHTRLVAVCEVCGLHTCSTAGCSYTCARCGRAICRRHVAFIYSSDEAYCSRC